MKNFPRFLLLLSVCCALPTITYAQNEWWKISKDRKDSSTSTTPKETGSTRGQVALEAASSTDATDTATDAHKLTKADTLIHRDATVFVDEMNGFEHYLMAAMRKKSVPLIVVSDPMKADYIIFGNSETKRAGWAKMFFLGTGKSGEMASISMVDRRTKVVVFADSSHRYAANRGQRSTAEKLAKYLGKKIKQDEKKLRESSKD
jgi:hypothetical protein